MGIQDRDYMKRPSDGGSAPSAADRVEQFSSGFFARHPRFFLYVMLGLVVLAIGALVVVRVFGHRR
jgi:hypothetical protein